MDVDNTLDHQIATEIERLRLEFTDTQEIYREVCAVLFFRYGITPTANKLYQLVRKGSMSAPAEALRVFWEDLREKSRVRIEHPDLPEALKTAAGELVATLWAEAQSAAHQNLADLREQVSGSIRLAQAAQQAAEKEKLSIQDQLEQLRHQFQTAQERSLQLERDLSSEKAGKESLTSQLILAGQQHKSLESALNEARREFASELEKQRQALDRSEERLLGSEKRALLEIDRERQAAIRLQQEMQQLRQTHQETIDRHLTETADLQKKAGEFNQKLGVFEGMLQAQKEAANGMTAHLNSLRSLMGEKETQIVLLEQALQIRDQRISGLETELASKSDQKPLAKPQTRRRKNSFF
jgi:predicted  nucleic acid-binding Zn-ribbon protein